MIRANRKIIVVVFVRIQEQSTKTDDNLRFINALVFVHDDISHPKYFKQSLKFA